MASSPIGELSYLLRVQKYHKRKQRQTQERLYNLQISCENRKRLVRSQYVLQHALVEHIRTGKKENFRLTFDEHRRLRDCYQYDDQQLGTRTCRDHSSKGSFLDHVSDAAHGAILVFLSDVLSDQDFLVKRLLSLTQQELDLLTQCYRPSPSDRSIFGYRTPDIRKRPSTLFTSPGQARGVSELRPGSDALSLLLDMVGHYSPRTGPGYQNQKEKTWATVCAKMLQERKAGSDTFIVTLLDAWSFYGNPFGNRSLETWLLEVLRDGQSLLEKPDKHSFRVRTENTQHPNVQDLTASEAFYNTAVRRLLALLKENSITHIIPQGVMRLAQAIVNGLRESPTHFAAAPWFLVTRWLFSSYMMDYIINPEASLSRDN